MIYAVPLGEGAHRLEFENGTTLKTDLAIGAIAT